MTDINSKDDSVVQNQAHTYDTVDLTDSSNTHDETTVLSAEQTIGILNELDELLSHLLSYNAAQNPQLYIIDSIIKLIQQYNQDCKIKLIKQLTICIESHPYIFTSHTGAIFMTYLLSLLSQSIQSIINDELTTSLIHLSAVLCRYYSNVSHINRLLALFNQISQSKQSPALCNKLLSIINDGAVLSTTSCRSNKQFFMVGQDSLSYIRVNTIGRLFTSSRGISICMWLYCNQLHTNNIHYIYTFITVRQYGIQFYINHKYELILRHYQNGSYIDNTTNAKIPVSTWCLITVSYSKAPRFSRSNGTVFIYVNATQLYEGEYPYPTSSDAMAVSSFGGCSTMQSTTINESFDGLLGSCNILNKSLTRTEIEALYRAGFNYAITYQSSENTQWLKSFVNTGLTNIYTTLTTLASSTPIGYLAGIQSQDQLPTSIHDALAGKYDLLYSVLGYSVLLYHPLCVVDHDIIDLSSSFTSQHISINAQLSGLSSVVVNQDIQDSVHSTIAGIECLLPIIQYADQLSTEQQSIVSLVIRCYRQMLRYNNTIDDSMTRDMFIEKLAYLLQELSPKHITVQLVDAIEQLVHVAVTNAISADTISHDELNKYVININQPTAFNYIVQHILLDFGIWYRPDVSYQAKLSIATVFNKLTQQRIEHINKLVTINELLHSIQQYLSYTSSSKQNNNDESQAILSLNNTSTIRLLWLNSLYQLISFTPTPDRIQCIISSACDSTDSLHVSDMLDLLAQLLSHKSTWHIFLSYTPLLFISILHRHVHHNHVQSSCIKTIVQWLNIEQAIQKQPDIDRRKILVDSIYTQLKQVLSEQPLYESIYHALLQFAFKIANLDQYSSEYTIHLLKVQNTNSRVLVEVLPEVVDAVTLKNASAVSLILYLLQSSIVCTAQQSPISPSRRVYNDDNALISDVHVPYVQLTTALSELDTVIANSSTAVKAELYHNQHTLQSLVKLLFGAAGIVNNTELPSHQHRLSPVLSDDNTTQMMLTSKIIQALLLSSIEETYDGYIACYTVFIMMQSIIDQSNHHITSHQIDLIQQDLFCGLLQRLSMYDQHSNTLSRHNIITYNFSRLVDIIENVLYFEPSVDLAFRVMKLDAEEQLDDDGALLNDNNHIDNDTWLVYDKQRITAEYNQSTIDKHTTIIDELAKCCINLHIDLLSIPTLPSVKQASTTTLFNDTTLRKDSPLRPVIRSLLNCVSMCMSAVQIPDDSEMTVDTSSLQQSLFNLTAVCHISLQSQSGQMQLNNTRNSYLLLACHTLYKLHQNTTPIIQSLISNNIQQLIDDIKPYAIFTNHSEASTFKKAKQYAVPLTMDQYCMLVPDTNDPLLMTLGTVGTVTQYIHDTVNTLDTLQQQLITTYLDQRQSVASKLRNELRASNESQFTSAAELQNIASRQCNQYAIQYTMERNEYINEYKHHHQLIKKQWNDTCKYILYNTGSAWYNESQENQRKLYELSDSTDGDGLHRKIDTTDYIIDNSIQSTDNKRNNNTSISSSLIVDSAVQAKLAELRSTNLTDTIEMDILDPSLYDSPANDQQTTTDTEPIYTNVHVNDSTTVDNTKYAFESVDAKLVFNICVVNGIFRIDTQKHRIEFICHKKQGPHAADRYTHLSYLTQLRRDKSNTLYQWSFHDIHGVYRRRYNLQRIAVEIELTNHNTYMIVLHDNTEQIEFLKQFLAYAKKRSTHINRNLSLPPQQLLGYYKYTAQWKYNELSTFDYLMKLNVISGRTFNDLSQYPVFPFIFNDTIQNYTYSELQSIIQNSATDTRAALIFRDLSQPIGIQKRHKKHEILRNYDNFISSENNSIPKFHYGSFYSSESVVLHYLLRLEPYSSLHQELQNGQFDVSDRLFSSYVDCYNSNTENIQNNSELIPEFYYMSEFLQNYNQYNLGLKQDKQCVDNVVLPCNMTVYEFVTLHRSALECDYISRSINQWIDLIFGYKQNGVHADRYHNLYYYLVYENGIDLTLIDDDILKQAAMQQIQYFGQCPVQLFTEPHVTRNQLNEYSRARMTLSELSADVTHNALYTLDINNSTAIISIDINLQHNTLLCVTSDFQLHFYYFTPEPSSQTQNNKKLVLPFTLLKIADTQQFVSHPIQSNQCTFIDNLLLHSNINDICVYHVKKNINFNEVQQNHSNYLGDINLNLKQQIIQHKRYITSLCTDIHSKTFLVSTSSDCTLHVYKVNQHNITAFGVALPFTSSISISTQPHTILRGHDTTVVSSAINVKCNICISAAQSNIILQHDMQSGRILQKHQMINIYNTDSIQYTQLIAVNNEGDAIFYSHAVEASIHPIQFQLTTCNINFHYWRYIRLNSVITALQCTPDNKFVVCGSNNGELCIRRILDLSIVQQFDNCGSSISTIYITSDQQYILVGTCDSNVIIYPIKC